MNDATAALVFEGRVLNRILVEVDENGHTDFAVKDHEVIVIPNDSQVTIGWTYENGEFIEPGPQEPTEDPVTE